MTNFSSGFQKWFLTLHKIIDAKKIIEEVTHCQEWLEDNKPLDPKDNHDATTLVALWHFLADLESETSKLKKLLKEVAK